MNKKIAVGLISAALVFGAAYLPVTKNLNAFAGTITANADNVDGEEVTSGEFHYEILEDDTALIKGFTGTEQEFVIPDEIDGFKVTAIGEYAFNGCEDLSDVTIPDTVLSIGAHAFENCSSLESVIIPKSVVTIEENAFGYVHSDEVSTKVDELKIFCFDGSEGERYAADNGFQAILSIEDAVISITSPAYTYTGNAVTPEPVVKLGDTVLEKDKDYTVAYENNLTVGKATLTVNGTENYYGTLTKRFVITPKPIYFASVNGVQTSYVYKGNYKQPVMTVYLGSDKLVGGTDYSVSYSNNKNVGTAVITINGKGNYTGTVTKTFKITAASIKSGKITGADGSYTYNGKAKKPTVSFTLGTAKLRSGVDYTVSYKNNTNAGNAVVTVTGKGNYAGSVTKTFKINGASIAKATVSGLQPSYTYKGNVKKPALKIQLGSKVLKKGADYTITYKNNVNVGKATITIKGKGNYAGTITKTFKIKAASLSKCKLTGLKTSYKYDGTSKKPKIVLKLGTKTLKNGTDYTVSYKNNKAIGTATLTIKGKGNFTGTLTKKFKIVRMGWYKYNGNKYYFNSKGQKCTEFTKIGDYKYYFNSKGIMQTGWLKLNNKYYYLDRHSGKRITGKTVDSIVIAKDGTVQKTDYNVRKIDTMITAHDIVKQVTNPSDSIETKRLKCFKWVFQFPYHRFRQLEPIYHQDGWEITFANDIFKYRSGCCVSESAAVAFLFHECGYDTVYVCHDTSHAWVELNGRLYDPLFAEAKSFNDNYNAPFNDYRSNPVQRRKI